MATRFQFPMFAASLKATNAELQAEYAIAAAGGDEQHKRRLQAKLDHLADLHRQILGRPLDAINP